MTWAEYDHEKVWWSGLDDLTGMQTCWWIVNNPSSHVKAKAYFAGRLMGVW